MWERNLYVPLIDKIINTGELRQTRAGEAYSIFGASLVVDVDRYFPVLQGRKIFYGPVLGEFAAFVRGPKTLADFKAFGCNYWDAWGDAEGKINLDYGNAWVDFNGYDQLEALVQKLLLDPHDRRMIVSGWQPDKLAELSLPCCHMLYQFYVRDDVYLDMLWYQRSVDVMVGLPSDLVLAAAWLITLATECGYTPGTVKMVFGDTHIYKNHVDGVAIYKHQLNGFEFAEYPKYTVNPDTTLKTFLPEHITLDGYNPAPAIKFMLNT